jgi:hypothetical protein
MPEFAKLPQKRSKRSDGDALSNHLRDQVVAPVRNEMGEIIMDQSVDSEERKLSADLDDLVELPPADSDESSDQQARRNNIFARQNEFEEQHRQYLSPKNTSKHGHEDDYEEEDEQSQQEDEKEDVQ